MESFAFLYILALIVWLIIQYAIANAFYSIACMKGHEERKYFWWSFLVPLAGYLMVVALPDRPTKNRPSEAGRDWLKGYNGSAGGCVQEPGTQAEKNSKVKTAEPVQQEDKIKCPACGTVQNAGRTLCWKCGVKFENEAKR